jgi:SsrA-binding protein
MSKSAPDAAGHKVIVVNKKARFDYHILETFEAGIVLSGAEIKSVRAGGVSLNQSFIFPYGEELFLQGAHIAPYSHSGALEYDPTRKRKLLLHRHEIDKLRARVEQKGLTIVPLQLYLKRGRAKLEIALAKGKADPDKRDSIKEREGKREVARAMRRER